jgi:kynureninase
MEDKYTLSYANNLDKIDPLKKYREEFYIENNGLIYLDGNSLGRLPKNSINATEKLVKQEWGSKLINSWNDGWYEKSQKLGAKIAKIIGAKPNEVIVCDSTSINLYKLAYAALNYAENKTNIVSDELNFPSDIYILQGLTAMFNQKHQIRLAKSFDDKTVSLKELEAHIVDNTALVSLSHVAFKSAFLYDMKAVTKLAHKNGAMVLWDLSHSVGALPIHLNDCNVDLAIGCTYKYLNGGPGSSAFLYVREDLQNKLISPVWGWFGEEKPFEFDLNFNAAKGIRKFMAGTPPILSMTSMETTIDMMNKISMEEIRTKSIKQTEFLLFLANKFLLPNGFSVGSPIDSNQRGSHVSLCHPEAYRICKALIDPTIENRSIIPDFREPDNIRIGITPLYTTFEEVYTAVIQMKNIVEKGLYKNFSISKETVT